MKIDRSSSMGARPKMKSERMNAPDNQVSREAAKSAKAAGLLRVFAPSREPLPQFRQRDTVVVHGKAAHFVTAVIDHSQPPNRALSFEKLACALVRARLTSDVA